MTEGLFSRHSKAFLIVYTHSLSYLVIFSRYQPWFHDYRMLGNKLNTNFPHNIYTIKTKKKFKKHYQIAPPVIRMSSPVIATGASRASQTICCAISCGAIIRFCGLLVFASSYIELILFE